MLCKSTVWLAFVVVIAASGQQLKTEPCGNIDTIAAPAVCISTPYPVLTVNRTDGHINVYITVTANKSVTGVLDVTVCTTSPANPSGVNLVSGDRGIIKKIKLTPGKPLKDIPILLVQTAKDNHQSGHVVYVLTAFANTADRSQTPINVRGMPLEVAVDTIP